MKKLLILLVTALCAVGCVKEPSAPVEKTKATVTSNLGTSILGATNVNPKEIEYIDITFDKPMSYAGGYTYNHYSNNTIVGREWCNRYTYRFYLNLLYNTRFSIVINDSKYTAPNWDPTKTFWRDVDGNYVEELIIEFSTIPYPEREAKTFEIDLTNSKINKLESIKLEPNDYDEFGNETDTPTTQQLVLKLTTLLNHEILLPGDKLILKYSISSMYDISKVKCNLVDNSSNANYWKVLSNSNDLSIAPNYVVSKDVENPNIYEGTLTFEITEQMICWASLQLFCSYDEVEEDISIDFHTN
jgi:hypothetical protein